MPDAQIARMWVERGAIGAVAATGIAVAALRAGALSRSGAATAVVVGAAATLAGWNWGALLILYFLAGTIVSRIGRSEKERRTGGVVAKAGARDAAQVVANGGVFAVCALSLPFGVAHAGAAAVGALAASLADTFATEIGTLLGGVPRSVLTLRRVPIGTSGGISVAGTLGMVAGAALVAATAAVLGTSALVAIIMLAGIAGAVVDSLLGATLQERRWCPACESASERRVHTCGTATVLAGGHEWMDNDTVNFLATVTGAGVAAVLATL
ncbi:DUF92 domain-containing protein [soil metagenome]